MTTDDNASPPEQPQTPFNPVTGLYRCECGKELPFNQTTNTREVKILPGDFVWVMHDNRPRELRVTRITLEYINDIVPYSVLYRFGPGMIFHENCVFATKAALLGSFNN